NVEGHDRSNGRIFKLVYNNQKFTPIDLKKKSSLELVQLMGEKNEFYARHARRILQERGKDPAVHAALKQMIKNSAGDINPLHALWTLHVTGGLDEPFALSLLKSAQEYVRAWTIQLMCEDKGPSDAALEEFAK